jgi:hypothetical protein
MAYQIILLLLAASPEFAAGLPSFFIPNTGQMDAAIRYFVQTPDLRAGFSADAAVFQMHDLSLRIRFAGANSQATIVGVDRLTAQANFLIGNRPENWSTHVPLYREIRYRNLYPGIDVTYAGVGPRIKSEFLVGPGADPNSIRLEYSSADNVALDIDSSGALVVRGEHISAREEPPVVYQESSSGRVRIAGRYALRDGLTVGFEIGAYDRALPLIIDPVLSYATYLGGSGLGAVTGVAVDSFGDLYATGWTEATNFPVVGPVQASNQGNVDVFIAKLNAAGSALEYATYIGGNGDDRAAGIAVDGSGLVYVTGSTASTNFPLVTPVSSTLGGGRDAFALKLNASGTALVYSTYLGGTNTDSGTAIAVDASGNAYFAGDTMSANFPVLHAVQPVLGGGTDSFLVKLTSAGAISFSTFLGGVGNEHSGGVAVDSSDNVYIAGGTTSTNFPVVGSIQAVNGGGENAFLAKINSTGTAIVYSTYLGGSGGGGGAGASEEANGVAVDASGNAYLAGVTNSANFPVTIGALQTSYNGVQDAFAAKVNTAGNALVYSTYLGGSSFNWISGLAVSSIGNIYVAGYTSSPDFPTVAPIQTGFNGLYDAFVSEINATGNALVFSTYYGGTGAEVANAIALDSNANMFAGGQTSSLNLPLVGPIQSANTGGSTGWLARIGVTVPPPQIPSAVSVSPSSGNGSSVTLTAQFSDPGGGAALTAVVLLVNTMASSDYACQVTYTPSTNQFALANDVASSGSSPVNPGGGMAQNDQCTLNGATSSATIAGNDLTIVVSLIFQPSFAGAMTDYLYASDANSNTGFVARGTWTVTVAAPQPTNTSVSPNASLGSSQTFTFVYSDTQNPLNITGMAMLFSTSLATTNQCSLAVDRNAGTISLLYDNGTGSSEKAISSPAVLQNSQCAIGATSITLSGLSNIVTMAITFEAAFSGVKNIYMFASESGVITTGWVPMGTYTVAVGGVAVPVSVVPAAGTGPAQRFSFTISDQGGAGFITGLVALFSTSAGATTNACLLAYDRTAGTVSLGFDNPANGAAPVVPGSSTVVSNSQCTLSGPNTTLVVGVTTIVVTMDLTFNATFFGVKNVYLAAVEPGFNSGLVDVGTWTVTGGAPSAVSVSPATGSGLAPAFTFTVSDSSSALNISAMNMLITTGAPTNTANACSLVYNVVNATIGLYANNGTTLSTKGIGSSAILQNSQCAVGYTVGFPSGDSVVFMIDLVFASGFAGSQTVYLDALEPSASSGWVQVGTWTVP